LSCNFIYAIPKVSLGIYNQNNIIIIKAKSNENIQSGFMSAAIVNIKYLTSYNIYVSNIISQYSLYATDSLSNGNSSYRVFATASGTSNFNWLANNEYELIRFNVTGSQPTGNFEISNDQFIILNNGACYIEHSVFGDITDTINPIYKNNVIGVPLPIILCNTRIDGFELFQNYPNPFNSETVIRFNTPKLSKIKLSIIDVNGKLLYTLLDKELEMGSYIFTFNSNNLASGIYYYKLEANKYSNVKKLTIIK
jgi:hypothetical protein